MKYVGTVAHQDVCKGSKSEHTAVVLHESSGQDYVLRRKGGNPFYDTQLNALVGRVVEFDGELRDGVLVVTGWRELVATIQGDVNWEKLNDELDVLTQSHKKEKTNE